MIPHVTRASVRLPTRNRIHFGVPTRYQVRHRVTGSRCRVLRLYRCSRLGVGSGHRLGEPDAVMTSPSRCEMQPTETARPSHHTSAGTSAYAPAAQANATRVGLRQ